MQRHGRSPSHTRIHTRTHTNWNAHIVRQFELTSCTPVYPHRYCSICPGGGGWGLRMKSAYKRADEHICQSSVWGRLAIEVSEVRTINYIYLTLVNTKLWNIFYLAIIQRRKMYQRLFDAEALLKSLSLRESNFISLPQFWYNTGKQINLTWRRRGQDFITTIFKQQSTKDYGYSMRTTLLRLFVGDYYVDTICCFN